MNHTWIQTEFSVMSDLQNQFEKPIDFDKWIIESDDILKPKWIQIEFDFMKDYPVFKKPKTDNEKILIYQKDYRDGKKDGVKNLFKQIRACAKRFIYHERAKKGFFITSEDAMEKATEAAEYILEQFIKRPDFALQVPSAYIRLRVFAALYRHKKIDEMTVFTDRAL